MVVIILICPLRDTYLHKRFNQNAIRFNKSEIFAKQNIYSLSVLNKTRSDSIRARFLQSPISIH